MAEQKRPKRRRSRKPPPPKTRDLMVRAQLEKLSPIWEAISTDPVLPLVRKSYVLSRLWAWACRIQAEPQVRIPVPRYFTHRDP